MAAAPSGFFFLQREKDPGSGNLWKSGNKKEIETEKEGAPRGARPPVSCYVSAYVFFLSSEWAGRLLQEHPFQPVLLPDPCPEW